MLGASGRNSQADPSVESNMWELHIKQSAVSARIDDIAEYRVMKEAIKAA